jgi:hypothetical protein
MRVREVPSSKARKASYVCIGDLFRLLDKLLKKEFFWDESGDISNEEAHKGWKEWVIKYTQPDKRGGHG